MVTTSDGEFFVADVNLQNVLSSENNDSDVLGNSSKVISSIMRELGRSHTCGRGCGQDEATTCPLNLLVTVVAH